MERQLSELIAIIACAFFAGIALYINLAEHPARMECGTELAATVFRPSYKRAAVLQVSLTLISFVSSVFAWYSSSNIGWLAGGLTIFSVIPFTFIAIMPTNNKLLNPNLDKTSSVTGELLLRWGRLHAVRSMLSVVSLLIFGSLVVT
jgi:anthrone oxygenase-like protein